MDVQALLSAAVVARAPDPAFAQALTSLLPGSGSDPNTAPAQGKLTLPAAFAQAFTGTAAALDVSFQVVHHPDEVVYTFFDAVTGQELFSVPPAIIVKLAEMFDSMQGVMLDGHA